MRLLELVVDGTSVRPEDFTQVASQIAIHAPRQTKNCPWPISGLFEQPQEKWEKHKSLWVALTVHEIPVVQDAAWEALAKMAIADMDLQSRP
jgi:hypothetical protein